MIVTFEQVKKREDTPPCVGVNPALVMTVTPSPENNVCQIKFGSVSGVVFVHVVGSYEEVVEKLNG